MNENEELIESPFEIDSDVSVITEYNEARELCSAISSCLFTNPKECLFNECRQDIVCKFDNIFKSK